MAAGIKTLHLINFRNHKEFQASTEAQLVIISGPNGAGKTSILEAISLLSPGKGLKNAKAHEILRRPPSPEEQEPPFVREWCANFDYSTDNNTLRLATGCNLSNGSKRVLKIDGRAIRKKSEVLDNIRVIWLIPQIDRFFLDGPSARRKFWDRICYNLYPDYLLHIVAYDYYLKSRAKLLSDNNSNALWLGSLEAQIAELALNIALCRASCLKIFQECLGAIRFIKSMQLSVALTGFLEQEMPSHIGMDKDMLLEVIKGKFRKFREIDRRSGRSNFGPHRADLIVVDTTKNLKAELSSTGEQKLILSALTVAQAKAIQQTSAISPLVLLDEGLAHLDEERQELMLAELKILNSQIWVTTTELHPPIKFCDTVIQINLP